MSDAPPEAYSHIFLCLERSNDQRLSEEMRQAAQTSIKGIVKRHPVLYVFITLYETNRDKAVTFYEAKVEEWVGDEQGRTD